MGRKKCYANEAERQKAYRERKKLLTAVPVLVDSCESSYPVNSGASGEARESTTNYPERRKESQDSCGGSQTSSKPVEATEREWVYCLERAKRAREYAEMFPEHVRPSDLRFQDAVWQWENEVKGRFTSPVGGSLSGTRGESRSGGI